MNFSLIAGAILTLVLAAVSSSDSIVCSDHAGGNKKLAQHLPDLEIVGGADDAVPACTRLISSHQELLEVGNLEITCLRTP